MLAVEALAVFDVPVAADALCADELPDDAVSLVEVASSEDCPSPDPFWSTSSFKLEITPSSSA